MHRAGAAIWRIVAHRYSIPILATAAALVIQLQLQPYVHSTPFLLSYAAVFVSAWYGGAGPGGLATALSAVIIDYFFLGPHGRLGPDSLDQAVSMFLFIGISRTRSRRRRSAR
jgi:K+-sensing histidine kinase KdpD